MSSYHYTPLDLQTMHLVCAEQGSRMLGVAAWEAEPGATALALHGLYVDPSAWGAGAGSALLRYVEGVARSAGFACVTVKAQAGAAGFFLRHGFSEQSSGGTHNYAHTLSKSLQNAGSD